MSHASSKKYIVNMLKSNDNIFRNQFFREVLFDKNGRRILLYRELSSNPFLRGKIGNILCAFSNSLLSKDSVVKWERLRRSCEQKCEVMRSFCLAANPCRNTYTSRGCGGLCVCVCLSVSLPVKL